jgi:beta-1,4-mannosyltransferase
MRVAYYYQQATRLRLGASNTNPYGELLCQALERRGIAVEFAVDISPQYLHDNCGRIDLLHLNWPQYDYYDNDAATMFRRMVRFVRWLALARQLGYRLVWTAHNLYPHNRRHQRIDYVCRFAICRLATAVIAHCDAAARAVRRAFFRWRKLFVIPHGNYLGVYPNGCTRAEARACLGVPEGAFAYGFFGNMQPYKGIEELIDSFRRLPGKDAWLVMSGGGNPDYLARIRERVADQPRIVLRTHDEWAPSDDVPVIMNAADVIALPYVATLTSGSVVLALSWAKPVIAPALGCLPVTVEANAGILYQPGSADPLIRAMTEIRDWDIAAASAAALDCAKRFDWDRIAARTVDAYRA